MKRRSFAILAAAILFGIAPVAINLAQQTKATPTVAKAPIGTRTATQTTTAAPKSAPALMTVEARNAFVKQYCQGCHNEQLKSGGMTLTSLDLAHPDQNGELAEKVIRKVRVGMMPPVSAKVKPDFETAKAFVLALESDMDKLAALHPNPGTRPFRR